MDQEIKENENKVEELMVPPPGVCWPVTRLIYKNCEGCKYWNGCTNKKKGKYNNKIPFRYE